jgi:hypothetical protein
MNWLKYILITLGLLFAGMILFSVIGLISTVVYYLLIIGVLGGAAFIGYKLLKKETVLELENKDPIAKIELDNAKTVKQLEEYKRKYLK